MNSEAEGIINDFSRLLDRVKVVTKATRLDLGDEAEALAVRARIAVSNTPIGGIHPLVQTLGERAARIANDMRARA